VGADGRQRIRRRLRQQLVAASEGDVSAGNVPDPDLGDTALLERVGSLVDVERRLELSSAQGFRGRSDGRERAQLDSLEALPYHRGAELACLALRVGGRFDADDAAGEIF